MEGTSSPKLEIKCVKNNEGWMSTSFKYQNWQCERVAKDGPERKLGFHGPSCLKHCKSLPSIPSGEVEEST
jgi:hypothetical protein